MKHLVQKLFVSSLLSIAFTGLAYAKPVVRITAVKGEVFGVKGPKTWPVKVGDHLDDFSDIMVEDQAQVSFVDFYEHDYTLSGGTQVHLLDKILELKQGRVWIQAKKNIQTILIQSPHATIEFMDGDAIVDYDRALSKTHLMTVTGMSKISNSIEEQLYQMVAPGQFSFVDPSFDNGYPRKPTPVGFHSYDKLVGSFTGVKALNSALAESFASNIKAKSTPARSVASVDTPMKSSGAKIIFIPALKKESKRDIASIPSPDPIKYYKEKSYKKSKAFVGDSAPIQVFGSIHRPSKVTRAAAMEKPVPIRPVQDNPFKRSLSEEYSEQKRHSGELNRLINELESYDKDFDKSY